MNSMKEIIHINSVDNIYFKEYGTLNNTDYKTLIIFKLDEAITLPENTRICFTKKDGSYNSGFYIINKKASNTSNFCFVDHNSGYKKYNSLKDNETVLCNFYYLNDKKIYGKVEATEQINQLLERVSFLENLHTNEANIPDEQY